MAREDHQPTGKPAVIAQRPIEEMRAMCSDTVALVLATEVAKTPLIVEFDDPEKKPVVCKAGKRSSSAARPLQVFEGEPVLAHVIRELSRAQVAIIYVLCVPELSEEVKNTAYGVRRRRNDPDVHVLEVEPSALLERTRAAGDMEVFGMPYAVLEIAHALAGVGLNRCGSVLLMNADQPRILGEHVFELCDDLRKRPGTDVVASWIQQLRRPPYLFATDFLDRLCREAEERLAASTGIGMGMLGCGAQIVNASDAASASDTMNEPTSGYEPVVRITYWDHVFGEQKLASNDALPEGVEAFFQAETIAALQAVDLAAYSRKNPGKPLYSPNHKHSIASPFQETPIEGYDRALVNAAGRVLAWADGLDAGEASELAWADEFGRRGRRDFPLMNERAHRATLSYLDSAATTQRVDVALRAQSDFDERENANVYRGGYPLSQQATASFDAAREQIEEFLGAKRHSVVFTGNTTAAINLVAQAWGERNVGEGDVIVTTLSEHHSCMLPLLMLAERKDARVIFVPYDESGRIDQSAYERALGEEPKIVAFAHVGNVFGIEAPVRRMAEMAHEVGARVLVDAAQTFGHKKLDVEALGADWLAFSGHKAYGPMGIGGLWCSDAAFGEMDPMAGGGGVVSHASSESYYFKPRAVQFEPGTPPVSQAIGLAAAIDYLDGLGMDDVARHDAALTRYAVAGLSQIDGVHVVGDHTKPDGSCGLVSFTVRGVAPAQLAAFLGKLGVAIRSGGHCALPLHASIGRIGTGRISIGVYTTRADIDAALAAIDLVCRLYSRN